MKNSILQGKSVAAHPLRTLVRMALAVALLGGVSARSAQGAERADGDAILVNNGWLGKQKTLIWRDVRVADLEDFSCLIWGGSVFMPEDATGSPTPTIRTPHGEATGVVMSRNDTEAVVQFRRFVDGQMWGVKVTFTQEADGVYAQANWARNKQGATSENDLETSYNYDLPVSTSSTSDGYGAYQVTAHCKSRPASPGPIVCPAAHQYIGPSEPVLLWKNVKWEDLPAALDAWMCGGYMIPRFSRPLILSNANGRARVQFAYCEKPNMWGTLVVFLKNGDCIYAQGGWARNSTAATGFDYNLDVSGNKIYSAATGFSQPGYGVYEITGAYNGQHSPFYTGVCGAWLTKEDRLVWRNVSLARVRNVRGIVGGTYTCYSPASEQHRRFTAGENGNPDTLEVQLNFYASGSTHCVIVLFTQQGTDVVGHIKEAKYTANEQPLDFDFFNGGTGQTVCEDISKAGYCISRLQADIAPEDGVTTQQTDADGNCFVLAGTTDSVADQKLAGSLVVNGKGPFALNGANEIGALVVEGLSPELTQIKDYWFCDRYDSGNYDRGVYNITEFVLDGNGVNTFGQLAWRDVTQLDRIDRSWQYVTWRVGLTLSGSNTVAAPFVPPSYAFFRVKSGRTTLPFLAPSTVELGNGSLFAVDEGATLAIGGYDHQSNYPINFAVRGSLDVADTLTLDGGASLKGTGIVTAKAIASTAANNTLGGVTLVPPADGCTFSGAGTVTTDGLTFGEGRTVLAANANLAGGKVTVRGTLAVPEAATVKSLDLAGGTLEISEDTLLTVTDPLTTVGTVRVSSADHMFTAWRTPRPFLKGPNLTASMVSRIVNTSDTKFTWDVTVTDEDGMKVCSLCRRPLPFSIILR